MATRVGRDTHGSLIGVGIVMLVVGLAMWNAELAPFQLLVLAVALALGVAAARQLLDGTLVIDRLSAPPRATGALALFVVVLAFIGSAILPPPDGRQAAPKRSAESAPGEADGPYDLGSIIEPSSGAHVESHDAVRVRIGSFTGYAAVVILPAHDGSCWVQGPARPVAPGQVSDIPVAFGGRDTYEVRVALTSDPELFSRAERLQRCPDRDRRGQSVRWLSPVNVTNG